VFDSEPDYEWRAIIVENGSTDDTWDKIEELAVRDTRVRAIRHRRNCGKATAIANGFSYGRGEIMVTTDADLQYDPNDIVRVIEKVRSGYDVVSAYKVIRRDPANKRLPSKFFNWFVRTTSGVKLHDFNAGLKAYRYQAANDLVRYGYGELHRFFILLAAQMGYSVAEVPVESLPRTNGHSKYGAERYVRGALDFVTVYFLSKYRERPLHFLGGFGLVLGTLGVAGLAYLGSIALFAGAAIGNRPLLDISMLLILAGMQLLVFGLVAEMLNNMERGAANREKIARVIGVDRRGATLLSPAVQVERRGTQRLEVVEPRLQLEPGAAPETASDYLATHGASPALGSLEPESEGL
jgi:dolichol-phosphate mannosyltransferase